MIVGKSAVRIFHNKECFEPSCCYTRQKVKPLLIAGLSVFSRKEPRTGTGKGIARSETGCRLVGTIQTNPQRWGQMDTESRDEDEMRI